jgi:hypothetical protein
MAARPGAARTVSLFAFILVGALTALAPHASAEDVDTSNRADTVIAPLSPYSIGLGAGAFAAVNGELAEESEAFLKLSLVQQVAFGRNFMMGLDADWFAPGGNWGGDLTVSYLFGQAAFRPFIGAGAGFHYFDKSGQDFGDGLGPSAVVHAGLLLDVLDEMQMRVRIPFHFVANKDQDRAIGLDVAVLFGSPLRSKKVKKLVY